MSGKIKSIGPCHRCRERGGDSHGDNLITYVDESLHCFACGFHKFSHSGLFTNLQSQGEVNVPKSLLPFDFTRDVPKYAWQWLLQWGLPFSYWRPYIGYSEYYKRLIFKVGDPLQFSIGRAIPGTGGGTPSLLRKTRVWDAVVQERKVSMLESSSNSGHRNKDLLLQERSNPPQNNHSKLERGYSLDKTRDTNPSKWKVWGDSHQHCEKINEGANGPIVLVEDLLSAHKVGQITTAIPLFGTKIYPCHLHFLGNVSRTIILWLDKDQEYSVKQKAAWLQLMTGKQVNIIISDNDPKSLTIDQICDRISV